MTDAAATHQPAPSAADVPPHRYTADLAERIELAWQDRWASEGTFHAPNPSGDLVGDAAAEKFYVLDMFPYPSGKGLHVGHPLGYIATDVVGRFQRMQGRNVLHALAYDAFGLPAEQYAVQTGQHPRITTEQNIATMRGQLRRLGLGHDDRRTFATTDPDYVRWTQWIFTQLFASFYDADAPRPDGGTGRARPIAELVAELDAGTRALPDGRVWTDLDAAARADHLDSVRLAYISNSPVNWAPGLGTVLSNEEVTADGRSERGNFPVFQRNLRQWMLRITAYADRLVDDLELIEWPEKVKTMQRNWIGRSSGAQVRFVTDAGDLSVFTTRPDTLFGATFVAVAPEHPLLDALASEQWPEGTSEAWTGAAASPREAVTAYRRAASTKTELDRQTEGRDKTGVFTGAFATNPVTGARVPVFVADYVLMGYGTGAIMAVPGQDERDWEFATRFGLPIVRTVAPPEGWEGEAYPGEGPAINSANDEISLDGLGVVEAKAAIIAWLEAKGLGTGTVTYRLRDWLFSRQRYWGEPFPVVFDDDGRAHTLPDEMLPVELPDVPDYAPRTFDPQDADSEPEPPLARLPEWVDVELDLGDGVRRYRRETNTMPNWAGSCWYELRYLDPHDEKALVDPDIERYWMGPGAERPGGDPTDVAGGADLYVGGVEHAVLHLLYARFWHKVLYDLGHTASREPFHKLFNQGYIQAYAYADARGVYVPADEVHEEPGLDGETTYTWRGEPVVREYGKMGKSLKNMVTPDDMYAAYGADTFRVYEMSMGPLDQSRAWETRAVVGAQRFLQRLWRNVVDETSGAVVVVEEPADDATRRLVARTIADVRTEYAAMRPNTAIAKLIALNNHLTTLAAVPREAVEPLVLMVAPVAPHIAEELWARLGHPASLAHEPFPTADPALLVEETVTCVVQVAGKVRDRIEVPPAIGEAELRELALATAGVQRALDGRGVRTVIVRAPRLVNVVPA
ncbi:leucyl-tRNA synthetase [Beutenbergia cavernae DSM 12333]|uniref:Leucine--tRNA ligase n=1 Tax=Beutenbergia cavernae (strain ATCC BAA-8 / DSM 12333 / CCUG 43141 / JCM 11478 / NBRC 16432 / NCIMB 13614 / HKI 0122) TaxID=471853 RepID=C5C473_BEUC1|nr:leucine--tRNA ligase [Beutenbergia cavernae]ACQ79986.1 leucyl-tRNA synthetase [Beutenbergia cavernae DSM 12333]